MTCAIVVASILSYVAIWSNSRGNVFAGRNVSCACRGVEDCYCIEGEIFEGTCPDTQNYMHCTRRVCNVCKIGSPPDCEPTLACNSPCTGGGDWTYFNGSYHTCDTPISCTSGEGCDDCTPPACPTGYTDVNPNNYCSTIRSDTSCSNGDDDCGDSCGSNTRKCYLKETNTSFVQANLSTDGPSSISMIVDGRTYSLSTDPNNPTPIELPAPGSSDVQLSVPTFTAPTTSRGANYYFQANNYGVDNEWKTWTNCSGVAGEDFCTEMPNSNNTQAFDPTSLTVNQVLKEGAVGQISAQYATLNKCDNELQYSSARVGYYKVDYIPDPPPDDPEIIFPDITMDRTPRGCSSLTYTGQDINNPLHVVFKTSDEDGSYDIQAATIWLSKDNTVPTTGTITGTYSGSSNQDLGIMIKKHGTDWSNPYIYVTNTSPFTFARITNEYVTVNGSNIARIYDVSVTEDSATAVTFDYKIEFLASSENLSGMYNVYGGALDTLMIDGNTLDQNYFISLTDWGIDLVNPVANDITQEIYDATRTNITWSVSDTISGIDRTVINAYRTGGLVTDNVTLYLPTAYTTSKGTVLLSSGSPVPDLDDIGLYEDTNAWIFTTSTGEKDRLSIGNNENGNILLYTTPYDKACNVASTSENLDLNPWIATRGGSIYSLNSISSPAKDVTSSTNLDGVFDTRTSMTKEKLDLGTELLATRNVNITSLIHSSAGAVRALHVVDENRVKSYWYSQLYKKFEEKRDGLTSFTKGSSDDATTDSCTGNKCYMFATGDIHIPSSYSCDVPTLFISEQNIYIEPDLESNGGLSGCIFLAKNNIYIGGGSYASNTKIQYDYIEGFFIADNQIIFSLADQAKSLRDGIEIYGGLIALGSNISDGNNAVLINRNLRLYNQTNPTLVITYDNRYANLSYIFFGTSTQLYKQEVGFKTGD